MKYLLVCVLSFSACSFSKPGSGGAQTFSQSEYGLTVDWLMEGERQPDPALKAVRYLTPSGETYSSDAPVTLPAAVPQSLILMGEFPGAQMNQEIDFLRAVVRFGEKIVYVPAQLVAEESLSGKRRLTFQVTGLNAAFRSEKSGQGILHIEIFARSQRIGILEAAVRTPPSDVTVENVDIKSFEAAKTGDEVNEFLKPIIRGRQLNLVRVIRYENSESLPVQIQTPRRPKGSLTQWVNRIAYTQARCTYSQSNNPANETLGSDLIILPMNDRFITEAEHSIQTPGTIGDISTVISPGGEALLGIYALGDGANLWMNSGPARPETRIVAATYACVQRCTQHVCEQSGSHDHFAASALTIRGCYCENYVEVFQTVNITAGIDRGPVILNIPKDATQTPLRFADLDPNRDGEVRIIPVLSEKSDVTWLQ